MTDYPEYITACLHAIWYSHRQTYTLTQVRRIYEGCKSLDETMGIVEAGIHLQSTHLIDHT